jgi:hypothetical protein
MLCKHAETYKDLVEYSVTGSSTITTASASGLGNGVKLIEEHDTRSGSSGFVKDVSDVCLGFTKPHGQKLGTLDGDEVGLTLVRDASLSAGCLNRI